PSTQTRISRWRGWFTGLTMEQKRREALIIEQRNKETAEWLRNIYNYDYPMIDDEHNREVMRLIKDHVDRTAISCGSGCGNGCQSPPSTYRRANTTADDQKSKPKTVQVLDNIYHTDVFAPVKPTSNLTTQPSSRVEDH